MACTRMLTCCECILAWDVSWPTACMTPVGFEPTPLRTGALSQRRRPLGQSVLLAVGTKTILFPQAAQNLGRRGFGAPTRVPAMRPCRRAFRTRPSAGWRLWANRRSVLQDRALSTMGNDLLPTDADASNWGRLKAAATRSEVTCRVMANFTSGPTPLGR